MQIVLHEPEIPPNTGNVARTCAVTGTPLHLVGPLGFSISDRHLKRAGLDYWQHLDISYWDSFEELRQAFPDHRFFFFTTKGEKRYDAVSYQDTDFLVFGSETRGLPDRIMAAYPEYCLRIPMRPGIRSLNLSNSVALVLYEALRQQGFPGLV
ncbi:MAG: tRNA (uridine(34)/cytosine(34)/5-carboxymethylaminomethyluridine(34)-2'-O)-methyltransferase TrmL [bacterium]|jgi:tRNA (cytidine/uridine-2'-O-)-methyltransferase|nr:tRNA (uridine(34)/cytosine(34)/5-carboxymethylaminomethyluridine(34)-2'-O)-methyltransferase TrmL [Bacillota bacterium]HHW54237.1 tRNA (uridine(34)/cytosine(34)/5-carboxymethylaminomethyluridine(34)-2'-O)-methyltransferase TrmL [Bacillota bacterium]